MNYQGYINTSHFSSNIGKQMPSATENLWLAMPVAMPCNLHQAPKQHKKPTKGSTMCARRSPRAAFTRLLFSQTLRWLRLRVSNNNSINMFSNVDPFQQQKGIVQLTQTYLHLLLIASGYIPDLTRSLHEGCTFTQAPSAVPLAPPALRCQFLNQRPLSSPLSLIS